MALLLSAQAIDEPGAFSELRRRVADAEAAAGEATKETEAVQGTHLRTFASVNPSRVSQNPLACTLCIASYNRIKAHELLYGFDVWTLAVV